MNFADSIDAYVRHKNMMGIKFGTGRQYLIALSRRPGIEDLRSVKTEHIENFLGDRNGHTETWRMKYGVLLGFFDFWAAREEIPYLLFPLQKPYVGSSFIPYIYSRTEVKALVRVRKWQFKTSLDPITMRTFLLFLYATGAMVGEVQSLSTTDLDLKARYVTIRTRSAIQSRRIPLSQDLCEVLGKYLAWRAKNRILGTQLFVKANGASVAIETFERCFRKQCNILGITREKSSAYQPRLHDLKCTFAVHSIAAWIRSKKDLNRMLPALSAYMGMKLVSSERYFYLTPERFRKPLHQLSPKGHSNHWRNNAELMTFLKNL